MDDPEMILNGALENHYKMINEFKEDSSTLCQDPDPNPEGRKMTHKNRKKSRNFIS
jgi:hypothetical protein